MPADGSPLTLYLASWQERMVKDFVDKAQFPKLDLSKVEKVIIVNPHKGCLASYKMPDQGMRKRDWVLYLTDEQMRIVKERFSLRTPVTAINVTEDGVAKGMVAFA